MSFNPSIFIRYIFKQDIAHNQDIATITVVEKMKNYYEKIAENKDISVTEKNH